MQAHGRLAVASFAFHLLAAWLAWEVVRWSSAQAHDLKHAAELSTLEAKVTSTVVKAGNRAVSWGLSWFREPRPEEEADEYEQTVARAQAHGRRALLMSILLATSVAGFLALLYFGVRPALDDGVRLCARHMCYTSLVLFLVGVSATAICLVAFKEMPIIGKVIFKFEAKGIAATIAKMFSSGNVLLGGLILVLSIVFPLLKLVMTWCATLAEGSRHDTAMKLVTQAGKWSMADVFVIAVVLSCFAIDGDNLTDATVGPGVYFFAAYCVVSLLAGIVLSGSSSKPVAAGED